MSLSLVGDLGGTNIRLALVQEGRLGTPWRARCADYATVEAALDAFLTSEAGGVRPGRTVLAVAGPVDGGAVGFLKSGWTMSEGSLAAAGFGRVRLLNDFAAMALATVILGPEDVEPIGGVSPDPLATRVALGPGTGFGLGAVVPAAHGWTPVAGEGGHASFAPTDEVEREIVRVLSPVHGRVSIERLLSGSGLTVLHAALAEVDGRTSPPLDPVAITAAALNGDAAAAATVTRFWAIFASVCGDQALIFGARGGVFVGGGVADKLAPLLDLQAFRARFEAKGRRRPYLETVATARILDPYAALHGAARLLDDPW